MSGQYACQLGRECEMCLPFVVPRGVLKIAPNNRDGSYFTFKWINFPAVMAGPPLQGRGATGFRGCHFFRPQWVVLRSNWICEKCVFSLEISPQAVIDERVLFI